MFVVVGDDFLIVNENMLFILDVFVNDFDLLGDIVNLGFD